MSKALEALKENRNLVLFNNVSDRAKYSDNSDIIEKELDALEIIRRTLFVEPREYHLSDGTTEYVLKYDVYSRSIAKEEFDLLKEALQ